MGKPGKKIQGDTGSSKPSVQEAQSGVKGGDAPQVHGEIRRIPIDQIEPNPWNP